jgi:hypothetical protein
MAFILVSLECSQKKLSYDPPLVCPHFQRPVVRPPKIDHLSQATPEKHWIVVPAITLRMKKI